LKNRSENSAGRGQILSIFWSIVILLSKEIGEIWTGQADLQPIFFKSDRLLACVTFPHCATTSIVVHSETESGDIPDASGRVLS